MHVIESGTLDAVKPEIGDHAVDRRMRTRCQRRVTHDRLGIRVTMMRVDKNDSIPAQVVEASVAEVGAKAVNEIPTKLIDCNLEDKLGAFLRHGRTSPGERREC